jgi:hypothetical protein
MRAGPLRSSVIIRPSPPAIRSTSPRASACAPSKLVLRLAATRERVLSAGGRPAAGPACVLSLVETDEMAQADAAAELSTVMGEPVSTRAGIPTPFTRSVTFAKPLAGSLSCHWCVCARVYSVCSLSRTSAKLHAAVHIVNAYTWLMLLLCWSEVQPMPCAAAHESRTHKPYQRDSRETIRQLLHATLVAIKCNRGGLHLLGLLISCRHAELSRRPPWVCMHTQRNDTCAHALDFVFEESV